MNVRITRRTMLAGIGLAIGGAGASACARDGDRAPSDAATAPPIAFDPSAFTEKTATITTAAGVKNVTYRFYGPITYVAKPVNPDYQSLVISVPTSIDGQAVDTKNAPMVFANAVGGYMPATVKDATGVGQASMEMGPMPGGLPAPGGAPPSSNGGVPSGGNAMLDTTGKMVSLAQLAVAAGYVAVEPGCRGRSLVDASGDYYGTAPAAIVDLKAAIRFLRSNAGTIPGNTDRIVSTGTSAGGALSALLGASGDSPLYDRYLEALGAAEVSDAIFASGDWCPITDLEHADAAYEWNWGANPTAAGGQVDQAVSGVLIRQFAEHQDSLQLPGLNNFGVLTADNYHDYLLQTYLQPAATTYLGALADHDRTAYLAQNPTITWSDGRANFTWADFVSHVGARKKGTPAFDAFDLSAGENNLFGAGTTKSRHFTPYSASNDTSGVGTLGDDIPDLLALMNPMTHLARSGTKVADHWWIRLGTSDSDTALTVSANLAAKVAAAGAEVNHIMYWDEGHGANTDAADFIAWVGRIAG